MRTVKIGDKELGLRATPLALLYYKQAFDKDLIEDLVSFQNMAEIENGDFSGFDSVKILQICYAMNKADNFGKQFPDFEKWLSKLDSIDLADQEFMLAIIEEATNGFFRSASAGKGENSKQKK
jgi:hypothetical protein